MSVLIKGMEMPKDCSECNFMHTTYMLNRHVCLAGDVFEIKVNSGIDANCPLVEIPEPHGRLIDELRVIDAIHERLEVLRTHEVFVRKHGDIDLLGVMPYIAKIPTVIKAEGSEDA